MEIRPQGEVKVSEETVLARIEAAVGEIAVSKGAAQPQVTAASRMLGGELPIDSLDLATIVLRLDAETGQRPFEDGFIEFHTAGELAKRYSQS
jgi:acyl carrier protein